ncbi:hypothetical protein ABT404_02370 [Streptomyces hyaluromycini]|uniref:Uncharacterized protein n=1 Tax=Streptomyces hyaluromycini TaxID=1377993 RepID=A0ABV1WN98_9ACTN
MSTNWEAPVNSTAVAGLRIAALRLGEAGGTIAGDLVAAGSDLVLSVNSASAAPDALRAGLAGTAPGCGRRRHARRPCRTPADQHGEPGSAAPAVDAVGTATACRVRRTRPTRRTLWTLRTR